MSMMTGRVCPFVLQTFSSEPSPINHRELTPPHLKDWENSIASSDQADSLIDDEIKEMDI